MSSKSNTGITTYLNAQGSGSLSSQGAQNASNSGAQGVTRHAKRTKKQEKKAHDVYLKGIGAQFAQDFDIVSNPPREILDADLLD